MTSLAEAVKPAPVATGAPTPDEEHWYVLLFEDTEETRIEKSPTPVINKPEFFHEEALRLMGVWDPFNTIVVAAFHRVASNVRLVVTAQSLRRYVRSTSY